jgi:small subunit ribosomal protein S21
LAEVHIQDGETLENALRRFKRKVLQEDIIKEVKRHAFYLKPGQKKRINPRWRVSATARNAIATSPRAKFDSVCVGVGASQWPITLRP